MPPTTPPQQQRPDRKPPWWAIASLVVNAARLTWDVLRAFGVGGP